MNGPDFSKSELLPVIAQDETSGDVLMLAYMNEASVCRNIEDRPCLLLQSQPRAVVAER